MTCSLKTAVPVGSRTLYLAGAFGRTAGLVTNEVVVSSGTHDPSGSNNDAKTPVTVVKR